MNRVNSVLICAFGFVSALHAPAATAATESVRYSFCARSNCTDGDVPEGPLIDVGEKLYGVTALGGRKNNGTVFSFDPATGTESVLYFFKGPRRDGNSPSPGLLNVKGILYGATTFGTGRLGSCGAGVPGCGTIFSVDRKSKAEKILHSFTSGGGGSFPNGSLINVGGTLYGAASAGGDDYGTIFSFNLAKGSFTDLYNFTGGGDGLGPNGDLIKVGGTLYGTTFWGGVYNCGYGCGTVYSLDLATNSETVIYSFQNNDTSGWAPFGGLINVNGTLYGVTQGGGSGTCTNQCGTVYSLDPGTGVESIVYSFQGNGTDGWGPSGGLINVNGTLYGVTAGGGTGTCSCGTVYSLDPATGVETIVYSFQGGPDGAAPFDGLINVNGTLYGVTESGGNNGDGTVYEITL